jgi:hypothetical protein
MRSRATIAGVVGASGLSIDRLADSAAPEQKTQPSGEGRLASSRRFSGY